jgi:AcrR family transcriptional regulator
MGDMEPSVVSVAPLEARPLRRDAERNRRRVLEAARELVAERGLDVTLDDVARHAGVGVGTVYRRVSGKEELVEALFEEHLDQLVARARRELGQDDPWEAFAGLLAGLTEELVCDHGLREVMLSGTYARERAVKVRAELVPVTQAIVRRAQEAGVLRPDFRETDIPAIGLMLGSVRHYTQPVRPEAWRRHLAFLLDGLRLRPGLTPLSEPALTHPELDRLAGVMDGRK